jgi:hypothetical protein
VHRVCCDSQEHTVYRIRADRIANVRNDTLTFIELGFGDRGATVSELTDAVTVSESANKTNDSNALFFFFFFFSFRDAQTIVN